MRLKGAWLLCFFIITTLSLTEVNSLFLKFAKKNRSFPYYPYYGNYPYYGTYPYYGSYGNYNENFQSNGGHYGSQGTAYDYVIPVRYVRVRPHYQDYYYDSSGSPTWTSKFNKFQRVNYERW